MKNALVKTDFKFPGQKSVYHGKVRDVYNIDDELLVMVVSDRISAFDVILPEGIPYKGQVLNQIAAKFLDAYVGHCPELEGGYSRSDGDRGAALRTIQGRNGRAGIFDGTCMARVQGRQTNALR